MGVTRDNIALLANQIKDAVELLTGDAAELGRSSKARGSSYKLTEFHRCIALAAESAAHRGGRAVQEHYRVYLHKQRGKNGFDYPTLSYWCFNPGLAMEKLKDLGVRSLLLTSGTLSPLDSFAAELHLPFPVRIENEHVIDKKQVWGGIIPVGPNRTALNSSYEYRERKEYKEDLGCLIANVSRIVPDGMLVFFPTYGHLQSAIDSWKAVAPGGGSSLWDRIVRYKLPVVEPRDSAMFNAAAEDFKSKLNDPSSAGAIFFAVCRGKASEGIDFSDRAGRAVIITGIPFAPVMDPKVTTKKQVLDEGFRATRGRPGPQLLTGDRWYVQQAARAVNQAVGRVIRHIHDYGAVLLCDERFKGGQQRGALSKWLQGHVHEYPHFGAAASSLTKFFADMRVSMGKANGKPEAAKTFMSAANTMKSSVAMPSQPSLPGTSGVPGPDMAPSVGPSVHNLFDCLDLPSARDCGGLTDTAAPAGATNVRGTNLLSALSTGPTNRGSAGAVGHMGPARSSTAAVAAAKERAPAQASASMPVHTVASLGLEELGAARLQRTAQAPAGPPGSTCAAPLSATAPCAHTTQTAPRHVAAAAPGTSSCALEVDPDIGMPATSVMPSEPGTSGAAPAPAPAGGPAASKAMDFRSFLQQLEATMGTARYHVARQTIKALGDKQADAAKRWKLVEQLTLQIHYSPAASLLPALEPWLPRSMRSRFTTLLSTLRDSRNPDTPTHAAETTQKAIQQTAINPEHGQQHGRQRSSSPDTDRVRKRVRADAISLPPPQRATTGDLQRHSTNSKGVGDTGGRGGQPGPSGAVGHQNASGPDENCPVKADRSLSGTGAQLGMAFRGDTRYVAGSVGRAGAAALRSAEGQEAAAPAGRSNVTGAGYRSAARTAPVQHGNGTGAVAGAALSKGPSLSNGVPPTRSTNLKGEAAVHGRPGAADQAARALAAAAAGSRTLLKRDPQPRVIVSEVSAGQPPGALQRLSQGGGLAGNLAKSHGAAPTLGKGSSQMEAPRPLSRTSSADVLGQKREGNLPQRSSAGPSGRLTGPHPGPPPLSEQKLQLSATPCIVCKATALNNAHRAPCGHVACWACWQKALASQQCPSCKAPTRPRSLVKQYFR